MNTAVTKKKRFEALDVLRGLTMIIMALDHSRDFLALGQVFSKPLNIDLTTLDIFITRWVTHFAAPTFIFLAGILYSRVFIPMIGGKSLRLGISGKEPFDS